MKDAFDPEQFRLPSEMAADLAKAKPKKHKAPKRTEPFLQIPHKAIAAGAKVLSGRGLLVWLYIHHRIWADKRQTVVIGNQTLAAWGVTRKVKHLALQKLEAAGLIAVDWRENRSPVVTLVRG